MWGIEKAKERDRRRWTREEYSLVRTKYLAVGGDGNEQWKVQ